MCPVLAISMPGLDEWALILGVVLLIWGRRLPEIGRSLHNSHLHRGIVEFKKGLREISDELSHGR
jgi:sec-independent protein translocase protein TatA